ncbi:MAG: hypothetical protein ACR2NB_15460 [Solirubrobacteraceae bacterium]
MPHTVRVTGATTNHRKGFRSRGLTARAGGTHGACYEYRRGNEDAEVLADGTELPVRRARRMRSERVLAVELELGPGGVREPGVVLPLLLVCAVLLVERQNSQTAAAGAAGC